FTADGWFNTGDLGFLSGGALTITGREKDVIILGGSNYYSHDLESVVEAIAGVEVSFTAACGVRGPEDDTEQLAIFFHSSTPAASENPVAEKQTVELISQIRTRLVNHIGVSPTYVIPVSQSEIPKTSIGKIQRSQLVQRFAAGEFESQIKQVIAAFKATASRKTPADLVQAISTIWQSVLQLDSRIEPVATDDNFFDLGGTSLKLMQVLSQLQNQINPTLKAVTLFQYPTIASLAEHLQQTDSEETPLKLRAGLSTPSDRHLGPSLSTDIAIIGMAGRFPGAPDLTAFWQNLQNGVESITFFTDEELLDAGVDPTLLQNPNYVKASPTLQNIDHFDADFFGYSPKEAQLMDPQHRLLLECAWESLETAGYDPLTYPGAIGLYAGATLNTYLLNHVYPNRHTLDPNESLDVFNLSSFGGFQVSIANDKDYLTTRVSYKLNLRGPSINVQTACSTSLVSIHLAAQSLLQGECDIALAGGVSVETPQKSGYLYQDGMILSADGHCRAFDNSSRGTLFGSGVGLVVLKRLDAALADKDFIHAVIKGSAVGNDGGQKVGYLAPLSEGQARVTAEALTLAGTPANTIGYVEAHGTGTQLGDPIEIAALTQAFRRSPEHISTYEKQFCPIGSVKTNVGHLNIASGVVGFIKTALAVHYGKIPPSLHFDEPNAQIDFTNSPFYVNTQLVDWPQKETPRRAGINALGIGGTNVHMVLEQAPAQSVPDQKPSIEIFTLSAKSEAALRSLAQQYISLLSEKPDISLADICFTLGVGRSHFPHRLALVTTSTDNLLTQLQHWLKAAPPVPNTRSKLAFLFTGQGGQSPHMGRDLYNTQPIFHSALHRCAERLKAFDIDLLAILFPTDSEEKSIHQTAHTQPVLFAFEYALAQLWLSWGIQPAAVLGHSLGEYVAACIANVFSLEDGLKLVAQRGRLMQSLPETGTMLQVVASTETIKDILGDNAELSIAAVNASQNTVVSGSHQEIARLTHKLIAQNIPHKRLKVSHAFHSKLMAPMLADFRQVAESITYRPATIDIISNLTGEITDVATADHWVKHICEPVLFTKSIETLARKDITTYLECGPRPVLSALGQETLPGEDYAWLPSLQPKQADTQQILKSLARLYTQGHTIDWQAVYQHSDCHRLPLPTYPFERSRHWIEAPTRQNTPLSPPKPNTHPLLGQIIPTPLKQILFQQTISQTQPSFLQGHQVQGQTLLPGAAFFEMAIAAANHTLKTTAVHLNNVSIPKALTLPSQPTTLQTILTPTSTGHKFEIFSQSESSEPWILHCEGTFQASHDAHPEPIDL
ncbi:MAG: beta-ketoacyl synthase N-terminal-like domain-containing protein, partial [Cyanobacteria bacterium J06598_3]